MISACPPYTWGDSSTIEGELTQCAGTVQRYRGDSSTEKEALLALNPIWYHDPSMARLMHGVIQALEGELTSCLGTVLSYRGDSSNAKEALLTFKPI
jgi:DNA/RNA endonuclease YhcR with UshA esterase domain